MAVLNRLHKAAMSALTLVSGIFHGLRSELWIGFRIPVLRYSRYDDGGNDRGAQNRGHPGCRPVRKGSIGGR